MDKKNIIHLGEVSGCAHIALMLLFGVLAAVLILDTHFDSHSVEAVQLPSDICMIDGQPLMPELDYIGYGSDPGLVLKYVNADGDLVLLAYDRNSVLGVIEGDFCQSEGE